MGDVTKNFSRYELTCPCLDCDGKGALPTARALAALQNVRDKVGVPLTIKSGVRCHAHNKKIGGAATSRHLPEFADAFDIEAIDSSVRYELIWAAMEECFGFIEVCPKHVHLDMRRDNLALILGDDR